MKITNQLNLPSALVEAVQNDPYTAGASDISVTRLIAPPRIVALTGIHWENLVEDAADRSFSLMGQAVHAILERVPPAPNRIIEKRYFQELMGWTLSGQVDIIEDGVLDDYKFTSTWETMNGLKEEKVQQLNILAWLARQDGVEVNKLRIVAIYRDWSKTQAKRERDYPQHSIGIIEAPLWTEDAQRAFIEERIGMHQAAQIDGDLPECSADDMWEKPAKFALMKEGIQKAKRLMATEEDLLVYAMNNKMADSKGLKKGFFIEYRPGEKTRCENYCAAAQFCDQFNR